MKADRMGARIAAAFVIAAALHAIETVLIPGYSAPFAIRAMLVIASLLAVASIGQTLVVILGGIDLSIGSIVSLTSMIFGFAYGEWGWGLATAIVLAVVVGGVLGVEVERLEAEVVGHLASQPATRGGVERLREADGIRSRCRTTMGRWVNERPAVSGDPPRGPPR